jgi:hypothetical protein
MMRKLWRWPLAFLAFWLVTSAKAGAMAWYWSNPYPHGNDVAGMACFNGLTIQVTDLGQLYTSADLLSWTPRTTGTTNDLQSVVVLANKLVVTGANGTVLYSPDGIDYTCTNLGTTNWLVAVTASSNLVVAVGDNAAIYTSPDGATWTKQGKPPGVGSDWLQGTAYGGGVFVAVGDNGYVATSSNGVSWTKRTAAASGDLTGVTWVDTPKGVGSFSTPEFIAVSDAGEVIVSTNKGVSWASAPEYTKTTNVLYATAANNDSRLVAGENQATLERDFGPKPIWVSQFGILPGNAPSWSYFCSLWETNMANLYLMSGVDGFTVSGVEVDTNYFWTPLDDSNRSWLWQMTTNAGLYIAVGVNATIMTSDDGVNWNTEAVPFTNGVSVTNTVFFGVGGDTNLLLAVGNAGATLLSTNLMIAIVTTNSDGSLSTNNVSTIGLVWNPIPPPTTNDLQGVASFNSQYYVSGGNGTILASANGTTWTRATTSTSVYLSGLAVYPGGLVAVGDQGTILTSANGVTWKSRTSGTTNWVFRVRYLDGMLIAVGENGTILTSTNGTTWAKRVSGTKNWLNDITMVTNSFFIVGDQGTILASTNAVTWTNVPTITGQSLFGAATQRGQLVVAGDSGVILQTQVVPETTQLEFLDFEYTNNAVLFLVAATNLAVDLQFTLDSSTNLPNWSTGPLIDMISGPLLYYEPLPTNGTPLQYFRATLVPQN